MQNDANVREWDRLDSTLAGSSIANCLYYSNADNCEVFSSIPPQPIFHSKAPQAFSYPIDWQFQKHIASDTISANNTFDRIPNRLAHPCL